MNKEKLNNLYVVDFFKSLGQAKNVYSLIYLILNIAIIYGIFYWLSGDWLSAIPCALILYLGSVTIALSAFGEWLMRLIHGCKRIEDVKVLSRLEPIFFEVLDRVKKKHPDFQIDEEIALYIKDDPSVNAFAVGRKTVCVTSGLLQLSDNEIRAVLGHEFGHLATHDTDLILVIVVGNLIISAIVTIFKIFILFARIVMSLMCTLLGIFGVPMSGLMDIITALYGFMIALFVDGVMFVWTKLGVLLTMKTSRDAEYVADGFSCDLGYSDGLLSFFYGLTDGRYAPISNDGKATVFEALSSSHPDTQKRIERILNNAKAPVKQ